MNDEVWVPLLVLALCGATIILMLVQQMSALPPGPAFISAARLGIGLAWYDGSRPDIDWPGEDEEWMKEHCHVPYDYIWSPATDHTMAGWVRPSGRAE